MSKFDVEAALDRIDPNMHVGPVVAERIRFEMRAAVLAGREEARDVVLSAVQQSDETAAIAGAIASLPDP